MTGRSQLKPFVVFFCPNSSAGTFCSCSAVESFSVLVCLFLWERFLSVFDDSFSPPFDLAPCRFQARLRPSLSGQPLGGKSQYPSIFGATAMGIFYTAC